MINDEFPWTYIQEHTNRDTHSFTKGRKHTLKRKTKQKYYDDDFNISCAFCALMSRLKTLLKKTLISQQTFVHGNS